jgi:hypothetical protein
MKKLRVGLIGFLMGAMFFSSVAYAATKIEVTFLPLKYYFDGIQKLAPEDQQGFVYKGTTYVPLRFVSEALEKEVGYEGKTKSIYVGKQPEGTYKYLKEFEPLTSSGRPMWELNTSAKTILEEYIQNGHQLDYGHNVYITDGQYQKFEAYLIPLSFWRGNSKSDNIGSIIIYADDKEVYRSPVIASDMTKPYKVEADISGALRVKIEVKDADYLGMLEAKFIY